MRLRIAFTLAAAVTLAAPAVASAAFPHVVAAGESLSSVAATDGLTVAELAAANGLDPGAQIVAGSTLLIPPAGGGASSTSSASASGSSTASTAASASAAGSTSGSLGDGDADQDDGAGATGAVPAGAGGYVVQPGDTLSAIAANAGTTVAALAAANGLDPNAPLMAGTVLTATGSASSTPSAVAASSQPVGASAEGSASAPPYPTPERVSASQVALLASANGVPPSLAEAIGWQESGFNNDLVSAADARGVMQILPGTWDWIQRTLTAGTPLAPASAVDNVRGGVLLLHSLLASTGGDPVLAAAGYYQGLASVRQNGLFPSTQQYVNSVLALQQRFGGQ